MLNHESDAFPPLSAILWMFQPFEPIKCLHRCMDYLEPDTMPYVDCAMVYL
jgi:hypothetical protein